MRNRLGFPPAVRLRTVALLAALLAAAFMPQTASHAAEATPGYFAKDPFPLGGEIYRRHCAACHDGGIGRAPQKVILSYMTPAAIHAALTNGAMQQQGNALAEEEKRAVAEHLTRTAFTAASKPAPLRMCEGKSAQFDLSKPPAFSNWGLSPGSTHAIPAEVAGLGRDTVGRLRLKWAFGFEGANRARSQPALAGGAILVGAQDGSVFALDRATGCVRWRYLASAEVRTGIVVSPWQAGDRSAKPLAFFGDWAGNAYAVNALTGEEVWKVKTDEHPAAVITGTPSLHEGTLYVPVSSLEEAAAASPGYDCCTFRGSVLALDAATGKEKWRSWLVGEPEAWVSADSEGNTASGLGPSGVAVWNAPAIDVKRGQLYVATGDNYSEPATALSDAIVALDLATGKVNWHYQALAGDAWNVACLTPAPNNCPEDAGPDFDFGAGAVLARGKDGKEYVLAGQKSGIAYGIDPDTGKLGWQTRVGRGGTAGGIHFGLAADSGRAYVPVTDMDDMVQRDYPASPGIHALDVATGQLAWKAPAPDSCAGRQLCLPGYSGAISVTPELVLAGSDDGYVRILDAASGALLWETNTDRAFETVNGVAGHGGAISGGAAPIAEGGQLIVASGYGFVSKLPGNVLLVFEAE